MQDDRPGGGLTRARGRPCRPPEEDSLLQIPEELGLISQLDVCRREQPSTWRTPAIIVLGRDHAKSSPYELRRGEPLFSRALEGAKVLGIQAYGRKTL